MGQAKQRKAEIQKLKALSNPKNTHLWSAYRAKYVQTIKDEQQAYMDQMLACKDDLKAVRKIMESGSNLEQAVEVGLRLVLLEIATIDQIKDAAWEGFNGLLEATCVVQNIQHRLGLQVDEINPDDFIIQGPISVAELKERGLI